LRIFDGASPYTFLKANEKWDKSLRPKSREMSEAAFPFRFTEIHKAIVGQCRLFWFFFGEAKKSQKDFQRKIPFMFHHSILITR